MADKEGAKEEVLEASQETKGIEQPKIEEETTLGINEHIEGALCYLLGFVTGLIFLIIERHNKFVRFHAIQSIATFLPLLIFVQAVERVLSFPGVAFNISIFGLIISIVLLSAIWTLIGALWIVLIYKAARGEKYKLLLVGRFAEKYA